MIKLFQLENGGKIPLAITFFLLELFLKTLAPGNMYFLFEKLKMVEYGALLEDLFQIMLLIATHLYLHLRIDFLIPPFF